jgi:hypothetical protein
MSSNVVILHINIYKVCSLHNNILYLKNKEDISASTFVFIFVFTDATFFDPYTGPSSGIQLGKN